MMRNIFDYFSLSLADKKIKYFTPTFVHLYFKKDHSTRKKVFWKSTHKFGLRWAIFSGCWMVWNWIVSKYFWYFHWTLKIPIILKSSFLGTQQNDPIGWRSRDGSLPGLPGFFVAKFWVAQIYAIKVGPNFRPKFILKNINWAKF